MRINQFLADMGGDAPVSARYSPRSDGGNRNGYGYSDRNGNGSGCGQCCEGGNGSSSCSTTGSGCNHDRRQGGCERGAACGPLPCPASIAMAYTPMQQPNGCMFEPECALKRGTLFSGLELPLGNDYRVGTLPPTALSDVQASAFAALELALYLDTHPDDADALQLYNDYQRAANEKQAEFSRTYFPLTRACNTNNSGSYSWINDPWPWQRRSGGKENF